MRTVSRIMLGLFSVVFFFCGMTMGIPWVSEAEAAGKSKPRYTLRWDSVLPGADRFEVLTSFGGEAVLDKETGLVWEQSPDTTIRTWEWVLNQTDARRHCMGRTTGGRKGWRLPSVHELNSLIEPGIFSPNLALPIGHPFDLAALQLFFYWSATTDVDLPTTAWAVTLQNGYVERLIKTGGSYVWCVRSGHNHGSVH